MTEAPRSSAAIVTAAGSSTRMGGGPKKEYRTLGEMSVLASAVLPFIRTRRFSRIIVTVPRGDRHLAAEALEPLAAFMDENDFLPEMLLLTEGGATRRESVFRGLLALRGTDVETVLIHDGARPWISEEVILRTLAEVERSGAAVPVVPLVDAVKGIDGDGRIVAHYRRESTVAVQTPQGFRFSAILEAHRQADGDGHTYIDDTEVYERYAGPVIVVAGDPANRKITFPEDISVR